VKFYISLRWLSTAPITSWTTEEVLWVSSEVRTLSLVRTLQILAAIDSASTGEFAAVNMMINIRYIVVVQRLET